MSNQMDFTEGSISKKMIAFSVPIFLTNVLQMSFQFIDSIWVGNLLGAEALGAISISATIIFTVLSFIIGINSAALTVLSQKKGADDEKGLEQALNTFVFVLGIMSVGLGVFGFFASEWMLKLLDTPESLLSLAKTYLQINFLGIVFLFGYNFIATILRSLGDSKTPIRFVLIATILNTILDPILISVFDMGISGAALATILSQGIAFLYGIIYSIKKAGVPFSLPYIPEKHDFKTLFKLGLPAGLQMVAISGGVAAIMGVVASFGDDVVAGFGAAQRIDSIIMLPAMTLGTAVNSMAGQNLGIQNFERVSQIWKSGMLLLLTIAFSISTIVFFTAEHLIKLFVDDKETIAFGAEYLKIVAFFYPFLGINFVLNGIIRAAGAMFQVLVLNLISFWILRFPLTYLFSSYLGAKGIGYGIGASFVVSSLFAIGYYRYGKWREIKLFEEQST